MLVAGIDLEAVGALAGAIAAIVGIPLAIAAILTAREAKQQADAAKRQAEAAEKMARLAEADQTRATEPRLQIRRAAGGFAAVLINESEQTVLVYIENLRPVVAELEAAYLNDQLGRFFNARCELGKDALMSFPIDAIGDPGDDRARPHKLKFSVRVPETGRTGQFTATLLLQGGGWNAHGEALSLAR